MVCYGDVCWVDVCLSVSVDVLWLDVVDDGVGCGAVGEGFGFFYMWEWVMVYDGFLEVDLVLGKGFKFSVYVLWLNGRSYD